MKDDVISEREIVSGAERTSIIPFPLLDKDELLTSSHFLRLEVLGRHQLDWAAILEGRNELVCANTARFQGP
jgi:hypothetical protein